MKHTKLILAVAGIALLAACEPPATQQQAEANCAVGTVGGAVLGGIAGNQIGGGLGKTVATAGGAIAGGLAGSAVGCQ